MRKAKVTIRPYNTTTTRDAEGYPEIEIPSVVIPSVGPLAATDYAPLVALVDRMAEDEAERQIVELTLVWSDSGAPVRACCPHCGDIEDVSSDFLGDEDGTELRCHGCA